MKLKRRGFLAGLLAGTTFNSAKVVDAALVDIDAALRKAWDPAKLPSADYYQLAFPLRTRKYEYGVYAEEMLAHYHGAPAARISS